MNPIQRQFYYAFNEGNLAAAQELFTAHSAEIDLHWNHEYFFSNACRKGHFEFAQWLISREPTHGKINLAARDGAAFRWACRHGHLHVARWILTLEPTHGPIDIHMKDEEIFRAACRKGHLDVLEWLLSLEPTRGQINVHIQDGRAYQNFRYDISPFNHACRKGRLDVVEFLVALEPTHAQLDIHFAGERAFRWACSQGHLHVAQQLLSLEPTHRKFDLTAVFKEHPLQFESWHALIGEHNESSYAREDDSALKCSCRNGHLPVVQWLLQLAEPVEPFVKSAFSLACQYGHLPIAQWLLSHEPTARHINIHHDAEEPFHRACAEGHLGIAQWLLSLEAQHGPISIHAGNEAAFRASCACGKIEVARWLLTLEPTHGAIDIHIQDASAFSLACQNGQYEVAQWLFGLSNIHGSLRLNRKQCLEVYESCLISRDWTTAACLLCHYPDYFISSQIASPTGLISFDDEILCRRLRQLLPLVIARTDPMEPKAARRILNLLLGQKHLSRRGRRLVKQALVRHGKRSLIKYFSKNNTNS